MTDKEELKALRETNRQLRATIDSLKQRLEEAPGTTSTDVALARREGVVEGIKKFAWSKAGAEFVGHPPGVQLKHVLKDYALK